MNKIEIEPMGYVRRTRADSWKKRPVVLKYYTFLDELRLKLGSFKLGNRYYVTFGIPFPESYSKKKKNELIGNSHQIRPDLDNLLKALQDGLLKEDGCVHEIHARKVWSERGFIEISNLN